MPTKGQAPFERSVFVNCPFDDDYLPLLRAIVFTIHDCGFIARLAVEDTGSSEMRIDKITRIIRESCYSIHDISRVEAEESKDDGALPRFNMPFEAGLAMGASRYETREGPRRDFLMLEAKKYRDKKTLSDLAGQDSKAHDNDPKKVVRAVRGFLAAKSDVPVRGEGAICVRYERFAAAMPAICEALRIKMLEEMLTFGYIPEFISAVTAWQVQHSET